MDMKQPLIIFIPKTYSGGAEHVAARLSRHFRKSYDVSVVSFDASRVDYDYAERIIDLKIPPITSTFNKLKAVLLASKVMRERKRAIMPVASISLIGHPNMANVLSRHEERCIVSVRTYLRRSSSLYKRFLQKYVTRFFYNRADIVVAVCKGVKKDLVEYYGVDENKIKVIYPYFEVDDIQRNAKDGIEPEYQSVFLNPVIITAGRLTHDKGQWHLIKSFVVIKNKLPNVQLVILGRGELEVELKALAKKSGHADSIHFLGYRPNPFKYIKASSVFAFPSLVEGFGNALGEALACGTPVVAADCNVGPREVLSQDVDFFTKATEVEQHDCGFLIPPFDEGCDLTVSDPDENEKRLAAALLRVLEDSQLRERMAIAARLRAHAFDVGTISRQWDLLLK